jgi:hypothetical protein
MQKGIHLQTILFQLQPKAKGMEMLLQQITPPRVGISQE